MIDRQFERPGWRTIMAGLLILTTSAGARANGATHTPGPGSVERAAIMNALRNPTDNPPRVFVVHSLKVAHDWAWVWVTPQSVDGQQHYEDQRALLQKTSGQWHVIDQECGEEECTEDGERARIRHDHPEAPAAIFAPGAKP